MSSAGNGAETAEFRPRRLAAINLAIARFAWGGGFQTEFYTTFDYREIWRAKRAAAPAATAESGAASRVWMRTT